jgi:hypothetical protein
MPRAQVGAGFVLGTFGRPVVRAIRCHVGRGMAAYDIGASYGYHALFLSRLVEPKRRRLRVRAPFPGLRASVPQRPGERAREPATRQVRSAGQVTWPTCSSFLKDSVTRDRACLGSDSGYRVSRSAA